MATDGGGEDLVPIEEVIRDLRARLGIRLAASEKEEAAHEVEVDVGVQAGEEEQPGAQLWVVDRTAPLPVDLTRLGRARVRVMARRNSGFTSDVRVSWRRPPDEEEAAVDDLGVQADAAYEDPDMER
jgi:hypothetical protein